MVKRKSRLALGHDFDSRKVLFLGNLAVSPQPRPVSPQSRASEGWKTGMEGLLPNPLCALPVDTILPVTLRGGISKKD